MWLALGPPASTGFRWPVPLTFAVASLAFLFGRCCETLCWRERLSCSLRLKSACFPYELMMLWTLSMLFAGCASLYGFPKRSGTFVVELTTTRRGDIGPFLELLTSCGWS